MAVGIVIAGALLSWVLFAHKTFKGPLGIIAMENPEVLRKQGIEADKIKAEKLEASRVKVHRVPSTEQE